MIGLMRIKMNNNLNIRNANSRGPRDSIRQYSYQRVNYFPSFDEGGVIGELFADPEIFGYSITFL